MRVGGRAWMDGICGSMLKEPFLHDHYDCVYVYCMCVKAYSVLVSASAT